MKKNIFIVMTSLYNGGAERSLINLLNEIDYEKYEVDLLLFQKKGIFIEELPNMVNLIETPFEMSVLYGAKFKVSIRYLKLKFIRFIGTVYSKLVTKNIRIGKQLRWKKFFEKRIPKINKKYDIAIAYVNGEPVYFVGDKVNAQKKIAWVHNDYDAYKFNQKAKKFDKKYFEKFDAVISISDVCVDILKKNFPDISENFFMLPNISSAKTIEKKSNEFIPSEIKGDRINIISIGRLSYQKGFDIAIESAKILKEENIKYNWLIIGNGEDRKELKKMIEKNGVKDNVFLIGTQKNPYPYIKCCDIVVQSSRYEGKSVVLDEAKILKKLIVTTNYQSVHDQIIDKKEGIIVDIEPKKIAEGILLIINDKKVTKDISKYMADKQYDNVSEMKKYYEILEMER